IFNKDENCLNYFDSINQIWNCYCAKCETRIIEISGTYCNLDFYKQFSQFQPGHNYIVNITSGTIIGGCTAGDTALSFVNIPLAGTTITINNRGVIAGGGGAGGKGGEYRNQTFCVEPSSPPQMGESGGPAIATRNGVIIKINNYGTIAGGGGGGGGGGQNTGSIDGGSGGGGGAGLPGGNGGAAGGIYSNTVQCILASSMAAGTAGGMTLGGPGGMSGSPGGEGGARGQPGAQGGGTAGVNGGLAGKAISGGSGNMVINLDAGQLFGTID
ncbi:MAG: hypothetical protein KDC80_15265, partial [Saprospiraceae bacterium]|nr:hypothetical protein [Saprospiraceae bacterium]